VPNWIRSAPGLAADAITVMGGNLTALIDG
jgi:hypothetical protein